MMNLSKRENSTYRPPRKEFTDISCVLKDNCSVFRPSLVFSRFNYGHEYNYAFIPDFNRYYFVTNIEYYDARIEYTLMCDVMATYRTDIGFSSQYVTRAASRFNGDIIDGKYPTKTELEMHHNTIPNVWNVQTLSDGMFSIGIIGQNQIQYYLMSYFGFTLFFTYLLSDDYAEDVVGIMGDIAPSAKIAVDPLQYIASCKWLPFKVDGLANTITDGIKVGYAIVPSAFCVGKNITSDTFSQQLNEQSFVFNKRYHPYTSQRGDYLNSSVYTDIKICVPPVGWIDLDATTVNSTTEPIIYGVIRTDMRTGDAVLIIQIRGEISAGELGIVREIVRTQFNNSVDYPLSQIISQGSIGIAQAASTAFSIASAAAGNVFAVPNAIVGTASAIESAAKAVVPEVRQMGKTPSLITYQTPFAIDYIFKIPVDDDVSQWGRPLCEVTRINTLSGYILCENVELTVNATFEEQRTIISYMESGFFYE